MSRAAAAGGAPARATLLLPARSALAGVDLPSEVAAALGRADAIQGDAGERAQLRRHFVAEPARWPVAARARAVDASDAGSAQWLRADPAWIRPDINGARLFAVGEGLRLAREDADALLPALRPIFGDAGMPLDAPDPGRWYLRIAPGTPLPAFPDPADALGTDLGDAVVDPSPGGDRGADTRRWRALLSEAQVVLHNHPWNAQRAAQGKPPVNSLWFWGGGELPRALRSTVSVVHSGDALLQGLALLAGARLEALPARFENPAAGHVAFDLRAERDASVLLSGWLAPAVAALRDGRLASLHVDCEDGAGFALAPSQGWRFWRRPRPRLA